MNKVKPLAGALIATKAKPVEQTVQPESAAAAETARTTKVYQLGEPLNFRVKKDFKRLFKSTAAQHGLKMNELIVEAFDLWMREKGRE